MLSQNHDETCGFSLKPLVHIPERLECRGILRQRVSLMYSTVGTVVVRPFYGDKKHLLRRTWCNVS